MKKKIITWLKSGASLKEGIELFGKYGGNPHLHHLCELNPSGNREMLNYQMGKLVGISEAEFKKLAGTIPVKKVVKKILTKKSSPKIPDKRILIKKDKVKSTLAENDKAILSKSKKEPKKFRESWTFLSNPNCPNELKILAADKITAWKNYTEGHAKLFDENNHYARAKYIVENFKENRAIYQELEYYKKHGSILGKHQIFAHLEKLKGLKRLNIQELYVKKKKLEHNIWRVESSIKKGDKPHLLTDREKRIKSKRSELDAVNQLLNV